MDNFKKIMDEYVSNQSNLDSLNEKRNVLLKRKREVEYEIKKGLETIPELLSIDKMKHTKTNSIISIKKPGTWNYGWKITKDDLKEDLEKSWKMNINSPQECFDFINEQVKRRTISQNYSIEIKPSK